MKFVNPNISFSSAKPRVVSGSERIVVISEGVRNGILTECFDCYFKLEAFKSMVSYCFEFARDSIEVMGFLLGEIYYRKDKKKIDSNLYTDITRVVPGRDLDSSHISVKFTNSSFTGIFEELEELNIDSIDYKILGGYHSHPGRGCFISKTDQRTMSRIFNHPYNVSIVVDPISKEIKVFQYRENKVLKARCFLYVK